MRKAAKVKIIKMYQGNQLMYLTFKSKNILGRRNHGGISKMYCFACNIFKLDSSGRPKNYQKNLLFDINFFKFNFDSDLGIHY